MRAFFVLCTFLNFLFTWCQVDDEDVQHSHQRMAEMMKHDGNKRVIEADATNFEKLLKKNHLVVMMFWIDNNKDTEKLNEKDMEFFEVTAQLFQGRSVVVATCEIMANQKFAMKAGVRYTGMIKIFNKGKSITYSGQRSPDVLMPYLFKMLEPPINFIQKKSEKKQFDTNDLPKVIAYVEKNSAELKALSEAALSFQPMLPFYVIRDAKLAKYFHLKKLNSIQLIKPYEKSASFPAKKKITEESLVLFIQENKRQRMTKMRLENLHEIWAVDMTGYIVPVFAITKTEEGAKFFSMAKSLAKYFEKNENLSFVWIDPEPFPAMIDYWRQSFEINPLLPSIGVVDVHTQSSAWYKKTSDDEEFDLNEMKKWLREVVKGNVELYPMKSVKTKPPPSPETENGENKDSENESESEDDNKDEL